MERQDRERRKEEERLLREKLREEERYQREQRREMERREKFLQKEYIKVSPYSFCALILCFSTIIFQQVRVLNHYYYSLSQAEKMRLKEEMRREKEAARLKAANNRAAARRIAKESVELVEDERLELMELAALSKGLPSILALDLETLQDLDLLKGIEIGYTSMVSSSY